MKHSERIRLSLPSGRAEGKGIAGSKRTATAEGRLVDAGGRVYSHGTTTCLFIEAGT